MVAIKLAKDGLWQRANTLFKPNLKQADIALLGFPIASSEAKLNFLVFAAIIYILNHENKAMSPYNCLNLLLINKSKSRFCQN